MNDLSDRLTRYAVNVTRFCKKLPKDPFLFDLISQLIRSSSSPGANYSEAQSAVSLKDFHNKIRISLKELRESLYWLRFFNEIYPGNEENKVLLLESEELVKIFVTISKKTDHFTRPKKFV